MQPLHSIIYDVVVDTAPGGWGSRYCKSRTSPIYVSTKDIHREREFDFYGEFSIGRSRNARLEASTFSDCLNNSLQLPSIPDGVFNDLSTRHQNLLFIPHTLSLL